MLILLLGYAVTNVGGNKTSSSTLSMDYSDKNSESKAESDSDDTMDVFGDETVPAFHVLRWTPEPQPVPSHQSNFLISAFPTPLFRPPKV